MKIGTKEHYEMMSDFDMSFKYKNTKKEEKSLWFKGRFYQDGNVNELFLAYSIGYADARCKYL